MTIQECYQRLGGDYSNVLKRLRNHNLICRLIAKFLEDDSFEMLCDGIRSGDREKAFRAAHTLKGVCQNLEFMNLLVYAEKITEALRGEEAEIPNNADAILEDVTRSYKNTTETILMYLASESEKKPTR